VWLLHGWDVFLKPAIFFVVFLSSKRESIPHHAPQSLDHDEEEPKTLPAIRTRKPNGKPDEYSCEAEGAKVPQVIAKDSIFCGIEDAPWCQGLKKVESERVPCGFSITLTTSAWFNAAGVTLAAASILFAPEHEFDNLDCQSYCQRVVDGKEEPPHYRF